MPIRICKKNVLALFALLIVTGCATLPDNTGKPVSRAFTDTADTDLGQLYRSRAPGHPGQSGFVSLSSGLDALVARGVLAQLAEQSIDAQYYLYHNDLTGKLFTDQLVRAADRGVRIRLLIDDMALDGGDLGAAMLDSHPNIELRIFNPFSRNSSRLSQYVTRFGSVTRRMHNKSFTADNQASILGGRNIGDEYFDADPEIAFGDLDVLAIGPVVQDVSASFDQYWNSELAYPARLLIGKQPDDEQIREARMQLDAFIQDQRNSDYHKALENSELANSMRDDSVKFYWGTAQLVSDSPEKILNDRDRTEFHLAPSLTPYFDSLRQELIIFSPYFVPGKEGVELLSRLSARGVRVRVLTNSLASTDVSIVHAGYAKYRKVLLRAGIELYELNLDLGGGKVSKQGALSGSSRASLHAKSFVFDRRELFIGSLNLDPRSISENTEIGVVIDSPEAAAEMSDWFDANIDQIAFRLELRDQDGRQRIIWHGYRDGEIQEFDTDPDTGFWQRTGVTLMGLLPIESQL